MSRYRGPATTTLYVRNISERVRYDDLRRLFMKYGKLVDVTIPLDFYSGLPKGYCFVEFEDPRDAEEAQYRMDRQRLFGKEIEVEFARGDRKTPGEMRTRDKDGRYLPLRGGSGYEGGRDSGRESGRGSSRGGSRMDEYYRGDRGDRSDRRERGDRGERVRSRSRSRDERRVRERVERTRDVARSKSREPSFRSKSRSRSYSKNRTPSPRAERSNNHHKSMSRSRSPRERSNSRQRGSPRREVKSPRNSRSPSPA